MRIAVIGAGPGGLAAAHCLQSRFSPKPEILVMDGAVQAGGLASGFRGMPDWAWPLERFYHHLFTNDDHIINLTREVGLGDMLEVHAPATAYRFADVNYRLEQRPASAGVSVSVAAGQTAHGADAGLSALASTPALG